VEEVVNKKGSFSLEATLLFFVLFFVVTGTLYLCVMIYEQVYLRAFVDGLAQSAANHWSHPGKDMMFGFVDKKDLKDRPLYWRFYESRSKKKNKALTVENYGAYAYGKHSLLAPKNQIEIKVEVRKDWMIYHKIVLEAKSYKKNPLGKMLKIFGIGDTLIFHATSSAMIKEPAEFIRSLDFSIDTAKQLDAETGGKGAQFANAANQEIEKFFGTIETFFKGE
jgi:hypothetical protein